MCVLIYGNIHISDLEGHMRAQNHKSEQMRIDMSIVKKSCKQEDKTKRHTYLSTAGQSVVELLKNNDTATASNDETIPCRYEKP